MVFENLTTETSRGLWLVCDGKQEWWILLAHAFSITLIEMRCVAIVISMKKSSQWQKISWLILKMRQTGCLEVLPPSNFSGCKLLDIWLMVEYQRCRKGLCITFILPCLCTFWHAIPTSLFIFNDFLSCFCTFLAETRQRVATHITLHACVLV